MKRFGKAVINPAYVCAVVPQRRYYVGGHVLSYQVVFLHGPILEVDDETGALLIADLLGPAGLDLNRRLNQP